MWSRKKENEMNNKKKKKESLKKHQLRKQVNLLFFFFSWFFFFSLRNEIFDFLGCFSASWDLCLFVLMLRNGANVYLGCWYTWIWIIVALEIGVEMDIKPERDLLYFGGRGGDFWGVWWAAYGVVRGNWSAPALLWMSDRYIWVFPEMFFFSFRDATEFWVSGVGRLQSYF